VVFPQAGGMVIGIELLSAHSLPGAKRQDGVKRMPSLFNGLTHLYIVKVDKYSSM
jgi:hypothetical protein